jgi:hypothetical protein
VIGEYSADGKENELTKNLTQRVFGKAMSNAGPYDLVDILISNQSL